MDAKTVLQAVCTRYDATALEVLPNGYIFAMTPLGRVWLAGLHFHMSVGGTVEALPVPPVVAVPPTLRQRIGRYIAGA